MIRRRQVAVTGQIIFKMWKIPSNLKDAGHSKIFASVADYQRDNSCSGGWSCTWFVQNDEGQIRQSRMTSCPFRNFPPCPFKQLRQHPYSKSKFVKIWDSSQKLNLWFTKVTEFPHMIKCLVEICLRVRAEWDRDGHFYLTEYLGVSKSGFSPVPVLLVF